ncbi:MAG: crotonase/enoyl-CoA hydratase family protein [Acidimicrobiales bacterium]
MPAHLESDDTPGGRPAVSVERDGHVATLWLDRAERRNAMNMEFFRLLPEKMAEVGSDPEVRAVVVAARGPAFSVGLDLTALSDLALQERGGPGGSDGSEASRARRTLENIRRLQDSISSVAACPKPVLAAIHGYCIGGGVDLVSACDIRVCSRDAVFSVRETRMAMVADIGSLQRLPLIMTMGHVAELAYTGKDVDSAFAERSGLVNAVYEDQAATLVGARAIADEIAANSPLAVQGAKAVLSEARRAEVEAGLRYVAAWNAGQLRSKDLSEAVSAFFERRPPSFSGD